MNRRAPFWSLLFLSIFILALFAVGYFAFQLHGSASPPAANHLAAEKGYGVTIDLTQYNDEALAEVLDAMRQRGLIWLRQPVSWAKIEPSPGQFDWQDLDRVVTAVERNNELQGSDFHAFKFIAVIEQTPTWANPLGIAPTAPPSELRTFGNFARLFADRYGRHIDYYQIWHQPNLSEYWGDTFVDAAAYADMLREAALNIHEVDAEAFILTAGLAATIQSGPLNVSELIYLNQLYQAKANRWFDIVAIQPYGLGTNPQDPPHSEILNFRRAELVRQVMLNHADAGTPVWITAFGWVALPADWTGRPSPWSSDQAWIQALRMEAAIERARRDWPWLGPMLTDRWDTMGLSPDDPVRGFALLETPGVLEAFQAASANSDVASVGRYPAYHPTGHYGPGWRFALTRADIPRHKPRTLTIPFEGTRLDLTIRRGLFRGNLWITIDGRPANVLPQDGRGRSYLILHDPLREPATVTVARYLSKGRHQAVIEAEGGWEQWAIEGWAVYNEADARLAQTGLLVAALLVAFSGAGLLPPLRSALPRIAKLSWAWAEIFIALYARLGERGQIAATVGLASIIYLTQGSLALVLLPMLAMTLLARPDLGLALVTLALFFYQIPLHLPLGSFSPVEFTLALTVIGFLFRGLVALARTHYAQENEISACAIAHHPVLNTNPISNVQSVPSNEMKGLKSTDWAALSLVAISLLVTFFADKFAVGFREWRVVIVESVLFYFLVRLGLNFSPQSPIPAEKASIKKNSSAWVWRLIDTLVAGATLQAGIALYLFFFTDRSIDAEGVHRAIGLGYGSPNNLALVLERAWPILLAVSILPHQPILRRTLYGVGFLIVSLALLLTFSKGALLVGMPVCILAMAMFFGLRNWQQYGRRVIMVTGGGLIAFVLTLIPFSQTERFRTTLDFGPGSTVFFRLKLWQSSLHMLQDHWLLGVGPDNFLYQYRTRYILPEAWQEPDLNHPHNFILDFGTRLGIMGIALLLWLQIAFWSNVWRLYKKQFSPLILGLMGSMVAFLSHGLVDNSYFLVDLAFIFFLTLGIVQRLCEQPTYEA